MARTAEYEKVGGAPKTEPDPDPDADATPSPPSSE